MKENFVAYEYKSIQVKSEQIAMYANCLENFGWELVNTQDSFQHDIPASAYVPSSMNGGEKSADTTVRMQFRRDRKIGNKLELNRLEHQWQDAMKEINRLEKKKNAVTMGVCLGVGIIGLAFVALGVYQIVFLSIALGVVFAALGVASCGAGFLANVKLGSKQSQQAEPMIQTQLSIAYAACEQAHAIV